MYVCVLTCNGLHLMCVYSQYKRYLEALPSREELEVFHPLFASNEDLTLFSDLRTGKP